jgi:hypothetical protein
MSVYDKYGDPDPAKLVKLGVKVLGGFVALLIFLYIPFNIIENVSADEIVAIQHVNGGLSFHTKPGPAMQWFGRVSTYPKRANFDTEQPAQFNDGGHGTMKGITIQWEMPLDYGRLYELHTKFGSEEVIEARLIAPAVKKAIQLTGPMMSSKESYAEKRNYLISYVEDQIEHGVYQTVQREVRAIDDLTKQEKTVLEVQIVMKGGRPVRQEESQLERFGITTSNFSFSALEYDAQVTAQIQQQQKITMDVQTAMAEARKAEQRKITVEQQGAADAAEAKWAQEVTKAKLVTEAQQKLEVQQLAAKEADEYRKAQLLRAEGDAGYRRKIMEADNALNQRLEAWVRVNENYANAIKDYKGNLTPQVVMGGGKDGQSAGGVNDLIQMMIAQTAQQMGVKTQP